MKYERMMFEWKPEELEGVDRLFAGLSKTDPLDQSTKYYGDIKKAKDLVFGSVLCKGVIRRALIADRDEESVTLEDGFVLTGKMPARALARADELFLFVTTAAGYETVDSGDMVINFFADTWGSALAACAQARLAETVSDMLREEGMIRTHLWCPGQYTFDLVNQKTVFGILHPEDIGCTLSKSMMMVPVKSSSGIMGIVPEDTQDLPKPCDFCAHRKTCPSTNNGCAAV